MHQKNSLSREKNILDSGLVRPSQSSRFITNINSTPVKHKQNSFNNVRTNPLQTRIENKRINSAKSFSLQQTNNPNALKRNLFTVTSPDIEKNKVFKRTYETDYIPTSNKSRNYLLGSSVSQEKSTYRSPYDSEKLGYHIYEDVKPSEYQLHKKSNVYYSHAEDEHYKRLATKLEIENSDTDSKLQTVLKSQQRQQQNEFESSTNKPIQINPRNKQNNKCQRVQHLENILAKSNNHIDYQVGENKKLKTRIHSMKDETDKSDISTQDAKLSRMRFDGQNNDEEMKQQLIKVQFMERTMQMQSKEIQQFKKISKA